jgi:hypothetical protein
MPDPLTHPDLPADDADNADKGPDHLNVIFVNLSESVVLLG